MRLKFFGSLKTILWACSVGETSKDYLWLSYGSKQIMPPCHISLITSCHWWYLCHTPPVAHLYISKWINSMVDSISWAKKKEKSFKLFSVHCRTLFCFCFLFFTFQEFVFFCRDILNIYFFQFSKDL